MRNLSYENEFCVQFHFHANESHFHKNGFALRHGLKQRNKGTQKWPIAFFPPPLKLQIWPVTSLIEFAVKTEGFALSCMLIYLKSHVFPYIFFSACHPEVGL